jgi:hypothetical protein
MIGLLLLLDRLIRAFRAVRADPEFRALGGIVLVLLGIGTLFYRQIEGWSWIDSIYFCVVTLATVGYGDLTPTTDTGKIFTIFYILMGVGVLVGFASKLMTGLLGTRSQLPRRFHREVDKEVEKLEDAGQTPGD